MYIRSGGKFSFSERLQFKETSVPYSDLEQYRDVKKLIFSGDYVELELPFTNVESIFLCHSNMTSCCFPTNNVTELHIDNVKSEHARIFLEKSFFPQLRHFYLLSHHEPATLCSFMERHKDTLQFIFIQINERNSWDKSILPTLKAVRHLAYCVDFSKSDYGSIEKLLRTSSTLTKLELWRCFSDFPFNSLPDGWVEPYNRNTFIRKFPCYSDTKLHLILERNKKLHREAGQRSTLIKALASFKLNRYKDVLDCIARELFMIRRIK